MSKNFTAGTHTLPCPLPALRALSPRPTARQRHKESTALATLAESIQ